MKDGIVRQKTNISDTVDLYGCEVEEMSTVSRDDRIVMHLDQAARSKQIAEKIYDRIKVLESRLKRVYNAQNWNELMAKQLRDGKPENNTENRQCR